MLWSFGYEFSSTLHLIFKVGKKLLSKSKRHIFPLLKVGSEEFFDNHMESYIGKLKMVKWNRFDTDCKNEWAIFTPCYNFTGPLD